MRLEGCRTAPRLFVPPIFARRSPSVFRVTALPSRPVCPAAGAPGASGIVRVMRIEPNLDEAFARELYDDNVGELDAFIAAGRREPRNLGLLVGCAGKILAAGCIVDPESPHVVR